jgi:glycosyltransferase involved in cell wall biosynthesis
VLGIVTNEVRTHELLRAKVSVTPALGGESFGLVLAEAFACATPAVASDIRGYAAVAIPEASRLVPPANPEALAAAVIDVLSDEERRVAMGEAAREHALANYAWDDIARRLDEVYAEVTA